MKTEFENLSIKIAGPRKIIWQVLTDFDNYYDWNTVVPFAHGELKQGNTLVVSIKPPAENAQLGKCLVHEVVPLRYFVLSRKTAFRWLLYLEHGFIIESSNESADQFVFTQTLKVSGILTPLVIPTLKPIWDHFKQMNIDLKNYINTLQNHGTKKGLETNPQIL